MPLQAHGTRGVLQSHDAGTRDARLDDSTGNGNHLRYYGEVPTNSIKTHRPVVGNGIACFQNTESYPNEAIGAPNTKLYLTGDKTFFWAMYNLAPSQPAVGDYMYIGNSLGRAAGICVNLRVTSTGGGMNYFWGRSTSNAKLITSFPLPSDTNFWGYVIHEGDTVTWKTYRGTGTLDSSGSTTETAPNMDPPEDPFIYFGAGADWTGSVPTDWFDFRLWDYAVPQGEMDEFVLETTNTIFSLQPFSDEVAAWHFD